MLGTLAMLPVRGRNAKTRWWQVGIYALLVVHALFSTCWLFILQEALRDTLAYWAPGVVYAVGTLVLSKGSVGLLVLWEPWLSTRKTLRKHEADVDPAERGQLPA
jgi:hypothetical protein